MRTFGVVSGLVALAVPCGVAAQEAGRPAGTIVVTGVRSAGPEIKGVIAARKGERIKVTRDDGSSLVVLIDADTQVRGTGGLFSGGLVGSGGRVSADTLIAGLPVTVKTWSSGEGSELVASQIVFKNSDRRIASMIQRGTGARFDDQDAKIDAQSGRIDAQGARIDAQAAATEALRGRMADIDQYNLKRTTNVHFDVGKADISAGDKTELCNTATYAQGVNHALLLVIGYTDSTGSDDANQALSEKRAARVINYLQQACGWKPYRMLTPTGMAKADPLASNDTREGKAQNRRVAVNVLVSKSVDGM